MGFLVRVTPKGYQSEPLPKYEALSETALVAELGSKSHRRRLEAQRTLVRRGLNNTTAAAVAKFAADTTRSLSSRVAAVFALKQARGAASHEALLPLLSDATIAPWILRALGDRPEEGGQIPLAPVVDALRSTHPRTRKEALITLARLHQTKSANAVMALLADPDPIVAQTAVQVLASLRVIPATFLALDQTATRPAVRRGLLRALQSWHEDEVVDGLIRRLEREQDAARRQGLLTALCRLYFVDGPWKGDSWGTRPDTRGPYYQPEEWSASPRVLAALQAAVESAGSEEAAYLGRELSRHRIQAGAALRKLVRLADQDPALLPAVAAQLASADFIPADAIPALGRAATGKSIPDAARAQAIQALAKSDSAEGWRSLLKGLPSVLATRTENHQAEKARSAFLNSPHLETRYDVLASEAAKVEGESSQWADVGLLKVAGRKNASPEPRAAAAKALDEGWAQPKRRAQILRAAGVAGDTTRAAQFVAALQDSDADVADAARKAVRQLKIDPARYAAEAAEPKVADLALDAALEAVFKARGEVSRGEQLFGQVGCNGCHTVKTDEALKGPFLGHIAKTYRRRELAEAILVPGKTLAQGFVTHHFVLKDETEVDGFVVQEAADAVTIRTVTAQEQKIPLNQIVRREKLEKSLMPEGLVAGLTVREFASILDYLEALSKAAP